MLDLWDTKFRFSFPLKKPLKCGVVRKYMSQLQKIIDSNWKKLADVLVEYLYYLKNNIVKNLLSLFSDRFINQNIITNQNLIHTSILQNTAIRNTPLIRANRRIVFKLFLID